MGKFHNEKNEFLKQKALAFFDKFIQNHQEVFVDNDVFEIVDNLLTPSELIRKITKMFSERQLKALQGAASRCERLVFEEEPKTILCQMWRNQSARKTLKTMIADLIANQLAKNKSDYSDELFFKRFNELQRTLGLSDFEKDILLTLILINKNILKITDGHRRVRENDKIVLVAKCLDCRIEDVIKAVVPQQKLRRYNCIDNDIDFNNDLYGFLIGTEKEPLSSLYFKKHAGEVLPWDFYGDLSQKHGATIKEMIRVGSENSPANILLYGAPGTGKTSFAKTLAKELQIECYCIAQNTNDNRSGRSCSTPEFRFGALQICDGQIDPTKSMIIVDEADDMLRLNCSMGGLFSFLGAGHSTSAGDKGMLNSILDSIKTPTLWITNTSAAELDESSRRRFDYSIKFEKLNSIQRHAIWRNNVGKMKLGKLFDDSMLEIFANKYAISAGGITLCLGNIAKLKPCKADIPALVDKLMMPHCELLNIPLSNDRVLPAKDYSLQGLNIKGDIPLQSLVEAVRNFQTDDGNNVMDRPRMNLLLSGAPGTGKTEFVKYLGSVLKTKIVVKMGSDLLSMWLGESEKNIKKAFAEAEAEKAILFLDEIDGLVQNREKAQRIWEVTQVNELLYQMENFKGIMIGATNFSSNLDAATLRRFTFKLKFDYLDNAGKKLFFERMFQSFLTPSEILRLEAIGNITPGDFRTVRQGLYYLGGQKSNTDYLSALEHESHLKKQNKFTRKAIGF